MEHKGWTFHLLYSSVETYEEGNGIAIIGLNPGGGQGEHTPEKHTLPFQNQRYSAHLDDSWKTHKAGQSDLQKVVQGIAMLVAGATHEKALSAVQNVGITPRKRMGEKAEKILRNTVTGNIIPFRTSKPKDFRGKSKPIKTEGINIGWELLTLMRPKPHLIITLQNGKTTDSPWKFILDILRKRGQPTKCLYEKAIYEDRNLYYREIKIVKGALKGALMIGLPGVTRYKKDKELIRELFKVLAERLEHHGLIID